MGGVRVGVHFAPEAHLTVFKDIVIVTPEKGLGGLGAGVSWAST